MIHPLLDEDVMDFINQCIAESSLSELEKADKKNVAQIIFFAYEATPRKIIHR